MMKFSDRVSTMTLERRGCPRLPQVKKTNCETQSSGVSKSTLLLYSYILIIVK